MVIWSVFVRYVEVVVEGWYNVIGSAYALNFAELNFLRNLIGQNVRGI